MVKKTKEVFIAVLVLGLMAVTSAYGAGETQLKGFITSRTADNMTVRAADGTSYSVTLTDDTKVQMPKGLLHVRHQNAAWTELIPGLAVTVKGAQDTQGHLVASSVTFTKGSLQYASAIQAGLVPTKDQVEANQQDIAAAQQNIAANQAQIAANQKETQARFASLADYDVKKEVAVYFKAGSSVLSPEGKAALTEAAKEASALHGYLIEVKGFADSTGNAAQNQVLSKNRAEAVVNFLMQDCNISPRHILSPGAMGISNPIASNETAAGRKENRRVAVRVLVNKGLATS